MKTSAWLLFPFVAACSGARYDNTQGPGVTLPARIAEGRPQDSGVPEQPDASTRKLTVATPPQGMPDPEALKERVQWEYVVEYDHGKVRVVSVTRREYKRPVPTSRTMGRFALELWIGHELLERVRFDFPLLGAEEPKGPRHPLKEPPTFAAGATVQRTILVPNSARATKAFILDRATGERVDLPWPPNAPLPPPGLPSAAVAKAAVADAGARDAAADAGSSDAAPNTGVSPK
ncbi:MAG: hypothetical protein R3B13_16005 [Polyangiaceae bacterium]